MSDLERDIEKMIRRSQRWDAAHRAFCWLTGAIVMLGALAFQLWREWHIWNQP